MLLSGYALMSLFLPHVNEPAVAGAWHLRAYLNDRTRNSVMTPAASYTARLPQRNVNEFRGAQNTTHAPATTLISRALPQAASRPQARIQPLSAHPQGGVGFRR